LEGERIQKIIPIILLLSLTFAGNSFADTVYKWTDVVTPTTCTQSGSGEAWTNLDNIEGGTNDWAWWDGGAAKSSQVVSCEFDDPTIPETDVIIVGAKITGYGFTISNEDNWLITFVIRKSNGNIWPNTGFLNITKESGMPEGSVSIYNFPNTTTGGFRCSGCYVLGMTRADVIDAGTWHIDFDKGYTQTDEIFRFMTMGVQFYYSYDEGN